MILKDHNIIGMGILLAVIALIVVLVPNSKAGTFMIFLFGLVVIGALFQFSEQINRPIPRNIPSKLFDHYVELLKNYIFLDRISGGNDTDGTLYVGKQKSINIDIPSGTCKKFLAIVKPPAEINVKPSDGNFQLKIETDRTYYKSGIICSTSDKKGNVANISVTVDGFDSDYAFRTAIATKEDRLSSNLYPDEASLSEGKAAPSSSGGSQPNPPKVSKIVCTGEYQGNCPGPFDVFIGCPNRPQNEIIQLVCGNPAGSLSIVRTGIPGNRCGYSLFKIDCN